MERLLMVPVPESRVMDVYRLLGSQPRGVVSEEEILVRERDACTDPVQRRRLTNRISRLRRAQRHGA